MHRRRSLGAEITPDGVHFRVWAPARERVAVVIDRREHPLARETRGYFSGLVNAGDGTLYTFRLDDDEKTYPDPASRFQPEGPHGPSQVVDSSTYRWRHEHVEPQHHVIYEMHVGTFTQEGTYAAAMEHLPFLASVGITVIEMMPIHEFPGTFGWGYDGVDLWAPTRLYGQPDDLRRFVDEAHANGIAVILDVVYNHFGPDGCYLRQFTPAYFTDRYTNEWGAAVNFDGDDAEGVRELAAENAAYWIDEFHFDGLRFDATQSIHDRSPKHILAEAAQRARDAARSRRIFLVAENEPQDRRLIMQYGLDAMWNDDWHHSAMIAAGRLREAYYTDYRGTPQEFVSMAKLGFLYQGQWYSWQKNPRGTPSHDIAPERLICYLQNHDQIANSARGERTHSRPLIALLLLQPQTPMLFQGQEFGAKSPFLYFADHHPELAALVARGRKEFLTQFPSLRALEIAPPHDRATFERCKLDHSRRDERVVAFHRELIALRRTLPFSAPLEGSVLGERCLALRWLTGGANDRLLIVNLGDAVEVSDPLIAPPEGFGGWEVVWASEEVPIAKWRIPREVAVLLVPSPRAPNA